MKKDLLYLRHISDSLEKIESYTSDGRAAFMESPMAQDAVIRNFEIIGEATKRVSEEAKATEPDVPWKAVAGFRDVLIHDYMGVDMDEVWNVIEKHVPMLKAAMARLLMSSD